MAVNINKDPLKRLPLFKKEKQLDWKTFTGKLRGINLARVNFFHADIRAATFYGRFSKQIPTYKRCRGSGSGIRVFLTPGSGIRDPGSGIGYRIPDSKPFF
jgi:hypothetical protein